MLNSLGYARVMQGQADKGFSALNAAVTPLSEARRQNWRGKKRSARSALAYEHVGDVG